jgi:hypothetical protein
VEGVQLIKRICGHESPFTFKKNERYGRQRYAKFMATKCPECTVADIKAREEKQKAESQQRKELAQRIRAKKAALDKSPPVPEHDCEAKQD